MKTIFLILVLFILADSTFAVQPARKPFIKLKVDGTTIKSGDILTVTAGQKLKIEVDFEGGRRDFCKFPDTYADIAGTAQILSRGDKGISYILNDKNSEWKLLSEKYTFSGDEFVSVPEATSEPTTDVTVSGKKFNQTVVKVSVKAIWQFTDGESTREEENVAEGIIYLKLAGSSDVWFQTQNVRAGGLKNDAVAEKLAVVQADCDSVEKHLYALQFADVQQSIRDLQASISGAKAAIDGVKASNASFKVSVSFIGLPSDRPFADIAVLPAIKTTWATVQPFLEEQTTALSKLTDQGDASNRTQLVQIIQNYVDWQLKLPAKTIEILNNFLPTLHADSLNLPDNFRQYISTKTENNYAQIKNEFIAFIELRTKKASAENEAISNLNNRVQPIRLFDGMLRSYFNSISWAEWVNTREL
jgi:hypothetical protein